MKYSLNNLLFLKNCARAKSSGKKGFSLVELLLGLGLFAIIALCVYSTFWGGMKLSRRAQGEDAVYREIRWSLELMARELENMIPYDFSNSYPELSAFSGENNKITFISAAEEGLRVISYYLLAPQEVAMHKVLIGETYEKNIDILLENRQARKINYLMREEKGFADYLNSNPAKADDLEIIAANIEADSLRFSFRYLEDQETGLYIWEGQWQQKDIPRAVRIKMKFLSEGKNQKQVPVIRDVFIPRGVWGEKEA